MNDESNIISGANKKFPTFQRLISPRLLKFAGFTLLAIVTLIALFYAIENWRGAREWKRVEAKLREKGAALSFKEFIPPLPPDEENFASIPFFKPLFDRTVDPESGKERWQVYKEANPMPKWPSDLTNGKEWKRGERHEFVWKRDDDDPAEVDGVDVVTNTPIEAIRLLLATSSDVMSQIEVGLDRPKSQFPIRYEDGTGALLPHLTYYKHFAQLFAARAFVHFHDGDAGAALSDIQTSLKLADTLEMESTLISGLVRNAVIEITLYPVWQGLNDRVWNDSQLAILQEQLERIDVLITYEQGMRSELIFGIEVCDQLEGNRKLLVDASTSPDLELYLWAKLAPRGWIRKNKAVMAELHDNYSLAAISSKERTFDVELMKQFDPAVVENVLKGVRMTIVRLMMPALGKAVERFAETHTAVELAAVAVALERYRLKHDSFPGELSALVPEFVQSLPFDIIDGNPLRYRKTDDAFVLYSIGINQIDEGGTLGEDEKERRRHWRSDQSDWVWAYSPEVLGVD